MAEDREDGKTTRRGGAKGARRGSGKSGRKGVAKGTPDAAARTAGAGAGQGGAGPVRRAGGFRRVSDRARTTLDRVAGRYGFAQPDILLRWGEIVGDALAPLCRPIKVHHGAKRALGATLVVQADGARAPEVEHLAPRILERVNGFYGYRAVSRLRVVQTGVCGLAEPAAAFQGPDFSPSPAELGRAADLAAGVLDDDLRAALTRLGANVLARGRRHFPDIAR